MGELIREQCVFDEVGGIHLTSIRPAGEPCGVVLFIHGHGEFGSRYADLFQRFADRGLLVLIPDLPGHGLSAGKRGHVTRVGVIAQLFTRLAALGRSRCGAGAPLILAGHSMGGLLAAWMTVERKFHPDAVWLSSPLLSPGTAKPRAVLALATVLDWIAPRLVIHNGVEESDCYRSGEVGHMAEIDEGADKHAKAEVVHRWISMRLGMELVRVGRQLWSEAGNGWPVHVPLIFTQGGRDPVCSPAVARRFIGLVEGAGTEVTYHEFPEALHEPHRDHHAGEMMQLVEDWVVGHLFSRRV